MGNVRDSADRVDGVMGPSIDFSVELLLFFLHTINGKWKHNIQRSLVFVLKLSQKERESAPRLTSGKMESTE